MLQENKPVVPLLTEQHLHAAVLHPEGSKQFLKQIVPLSVSSILHHRIEFDDRNFQIGTHNGIKYQAFKPALLNTTLQGIRKWVKSAMKVLDKNYLRDMYLIFANSKDPTIIYESYKFQFKYLGDDVVHLDLSSTEKELTESTNSLLEAIDSLQIHTKYKEDEIDVKLAVTYYEDVLPEGFIPEHFTNDDETGAVLQESLANQPPDYMVLGLLKAGHHTVKCRGKGEVFSMKNLISQSIGESSSNHEEVMILEEDEENETQNNQESEVQNTPEETQNVEVFDRRLIQTPTISESSEKYMSFELTREDFRCLCKISASFEHIGKIECSNCGTIQHCTCLGYLETDDIPKPYICPFCTDKSVYNSLKENKAKLKSTYRLAIALAYFTEAFPQELWDILPTVLQEWLNTKLQKNKIINKKNNKYTVNMKLLRQSYIKLVFANSFSNKRKAISDENVEEEMKEVRGKKHNKTG